MGNRKNGIVSITCVGCGIGDDAGDAGMAGRSWLRTDDDLHLGVCSDCGEWVSAWDNGMRAIAGEHRVLDRLVDNVSLPSLSHVLLEIYDLLSSDTAGVDQIAILIETDAGLTARTLRLANSAYYGLSRKITTVAEAISRVGPFDLWWLLLTTEVKSLFYGIDRSLADMDSFWRHSLLVASASRSLSEQYGIGKASEMFVAGLLHDVGKLLLLRHMPVEYGSVLRRVSEGETLYLLEREMLGFDHAKAGARLLDRWQLPDALIAHVAGHHREYGSLTDESLVAVANDLCHRMDSPDHLPRIDGIDDAAVIAASKTLYQRLAKLVL